MKRKLKYKVIKKLKYNVGATVDIGYSTIYIIYNSKFVHKTRNNHFPFDGSTLNCKAKCEKTITEIEVSSDKNIIGKFNNIGNNLYIELDE